jgi:hypothetical protein
MLWMPVNATSISYTQSFCSRRLFRHLCHTLFERFELGLVGKVRIQYTVPVHDQAFSRH